MAGMGEDFKQARESRAFATADVARQVHIRPEFLDAIEDERWEAIGDLASLRGLLRTYARFLGLDGGAMVQRFNQEYAPGLAAVPGLKPETPLNLRVLGIIVVGVAASIIVVISLTQFVERARLHRTALPMQTMASPAAGNEGQL